jgi:hypothetical protein
MMSVPALSGYTVAANGTSMVATLNQVGCIPATVNLGLSFSIGDGEIGVDTIGNYAWQELAARKAVTTGRSDGGTGTQYFLKLVANTYDGSPPNALYGLVDDGAVAGNLMDLYLWPVSSPVTNWTQADAVIAGVNAHLGQVKVAPGAPTVLVWTPVNAGFGSYWGCFGGPTVVTAAMGPGKTGVAAIGDPNPPGFTLDGTTATVASFTILGTTATFILLGTIYAGDIVTISETGCVIVNGADEQLEDVYNADVVNNSTQSVPTLSPGRFVLDVAALQQLNIC